MTAIRRRTLTGALVATSLVVATAACGGSSGPAATSSSGSVVTYPVTVRDCDKDVTLDSPRKKILTVGSAAIALLDAAGASDRIVARSGEFGAELPKGLRTRPTGAKIVDPNDPTTEAIIGADVDTVYGYGLFNAKADDLSKAGIKLLTVQGECGHDAGDAGKGTTLRTISDEVRRLGKAFATTAAADASAAAFDVEVKKLAADRKDRGSATWVYYFGPTDPLSAYGGKGIPGDVMTQAGLANVFAGEQKPYIKTNVEALLTKNPRWIVLSHGLYGESAADAEKKFRSEPGVAQLDAVKNGRIVLVPAEASQPSPAAVDGLRIVANAVSAS